MAKSSEKININDEREVRIKKLNDLKELGVDSYPAKSSREHTVAEALGAQEGEVVVIAGRIMLKRDIGKLTFCHLADATGKVQIALKQDEIGAELYKRFVKKFDIGDIVQIRGKRFKTHKGEESVMVSEYTMLAKALRPLPDKFHGLQDEEGRYRKRYLDFLFNEEAQESVFVRARVLKYFREFLDNRGFVEVETPVLESVASGAMAATFDTYINAFDIPVHLRIAVGELWQKRLMVGGFEKTYEIGRVFRNEGVDREHNPEFTMLEYYWAYADHTDNMKLYEELIPFVVEKSVGTLHIVHDGHKIDLKPPYPIITFREAIIEHTGIDINDHSDIETLKKVMIEKGCVVEEGALRGKLLDSLFKQTTRPKIIQPTFVTEYPVELKPLTKRAEDPRYTAMFQLVVSGFELGNNYTELNDPIDQKLRFEEQSSVKESGEEEHMSVDNDFVEALEYGMPPATGTGIGIDRFVALITGAHTLREVIAFPLMKPKEEGGGKDRKSRKTKVAHAVILDTPDTPSWSKLNAAAHLSASLAAREGGKLIHIDHSVTQDGEHIPMNIQHAIVMKSASSRDQLLALKREADKRGLVVTCFTEEMRDSTNDNKVRAAQEEKNASDVGFLGVLVFGDIKEVSGLTDGYPLWS